MKPSDTDTTSVRTVLCVKFSKPSADCLEHLSPSDLVYARGGWGYRGRTMFTHAS